MKHHHSRAHYLSAAWGLGTPTLNNEWHCLTLMVAFLLSDLASRYDSFL